MNRRDFARRAAVHRAMGVMTADSRSQRLQRRVCTVLHGSRMPLRIGADPSLAIAALAEPNLERILATNLAVEATR